MKLRATIEKIIHTKWFEYGIVGLIILSAISLGLETVPSLMARYGATFYILDKVLTTIFVIEIAMKLFVYRITFFRSGWNIFDFVIVAISLIPADGSFSVLKSLRILRVLRLISTIPALRRVVDGFFHAMSGISAVLMLLMILFYINAVIATNLFGEVFPETFGTIGWSLYSLFQIMTLDSWSANIVLPVMEVYPYAWLFFIPFILMTTFAVLNLLIGIVVNSMQEINDREKEELQEHLRVQDEREKQIDHKITEMEKLLQNLRDELSERDRRS